MNHLLIDFDSTIPNLALMKISDWAKDQGDNVTLHKVLWQKDRDTIIGIDKYNSEGRDPVPDVIWMSCLFTWHRGRANDMLSLYRSQYPKAVIHQGGTGYDWGKQKGDLTRKELPSMIENRLPDYSLYRENKKIAVGFCQRGCNRRCQFCDVWRKEGRIEENQYSRLQEWVPDGYRKVMLLDNDLALGEEWKHNQVLQDAIDLKLKLNLTQGYDIRTITPERAELLASNKPWDNSFRYRTLYTAWDLPQYEKMVRRGIEALLDAGFKGREIMCYMLTGFGSTFEQDYHRYEVLYEEYGVYPYVMVFNNNRKDKRLNSFRRWVNKRIHKSVPWDQYPRNPDLKVERKQRGNTLLEIK